MELVVSRIVFVLLISVPGRTQLEGTDMYVMLPQSCGSLSKEMVA
jgi:hypothetical protein